MEQLFEQYFWVIIVLALWSLPWKGYALWKAAKLHDLWWFVALLVVNTAAILDILYIFVFSKRKSQQT
ncbi:MAG: DUF5652 family protein [bacterium]|nr:DUF5652 family protein [bacterium]